jgi:hypothetical protein
MISKVKFLTKKFRGTRTAYSSSSIFIAILANAKQKYDCEKIGESIFPNGFGSINPPGPSFGFGSIVLSDNEEDGKVKISALKQRKDEDGKKIKPTDLKNSISEYFDGLFVVNSKDECLEQVSLDLFYKFFEEAKEYELIHFCEFEPDED